MYFLCVYVTADTFYSIKKILRSSISRVVSGNKLDLVGTQEGQNSKAKNSPYIFVNHREKHEYLINTHF